MIKPFFLHHVIVAEVDPRILPHLKSNSSPQKLKSVYCWIRFRENQKLVVDVRYLAFTSEWQIETKMYLRINS